VSAWQAFEMVGMPEGEFFLSHACTYLAQAPKSNAITNAMYGAKGLVQKAPSLEVPYHLRNAPVKGMAEQGYGVGYQYAHKAEGAVVAEDYFPMDMTPADLYQPSDRGFEAEITERLKANRNTLRGKQKA
jgi:putative ATPase